LAEHATALKWPILGVLVAIAVTTTMDATGLSYGEP
jgi:hypothetical protein